MGVERLIILAPIEPSATGNGLAMRTDLFRRGAPPGVDALSVVVPVSGRLPMPGGRSREVVVVAVDPEAARAGARALLKQPAWRERLARAGPLPALARAASPGLSDAVLRACGGHGQVALHVMRSYLAPLGTAVAERLGPAWVTLDLDEDDAEVSEGLGQEQDAAAYARLVGVFARLFDGLSAASPAEAEAISRRNGLDVQHIPNAVELRSQRRRADRVKEPRRVSLLFVGNLTYPPNIEAATVLVQEVLPAVRRRLGDRVAVNLVGPHGSELNRLAGPGVEFAGFVPDLAAAYEGADVAVVPLRTGGGTRIKLLEAFAHRVPVVASTVAAAGLEAFDGRHLLLADDPGQAAGAVEKLIAEPSFAARLSDEAWRLVRDRYSTDVVLPRVRQFFARAAARGAARAQLPALS